MSWPWWLVPPEIMLGVVGAAIGVALILPTLRDGKPLRDAVEHGDAHDVMAHDGFDLDPHKMRRAKIGLAVMALSVVYIILTVALSS